MIEMPACFPSQSSGCSSQGTCVRSSDEASVACGARPLSLCSSCAAWAATAPAISATGSMNSTTVRIVVITLASRARPPSLAARRPFAGASSEPSSVAQSSGCQSGVTMRQTR